MSGWVNAAGNRFPSLEEGLADTRMDLNLASKEARSLEERIRDVLDDNYHCGEVEGGWAYMEHVEAILLHGLAMTEAVVRMLGSTTLQRLLKSPEKEEAE